MVLLNTTRTGYSINQVEDSTMTVGELIAELSRYPEDEKIMYCNDRGYTYGFINESLIELI